jgi:hypothetical protein
VQFRDIFVKYLILSGVVLGKPAAEAAEAAPPPAPPPTPEMNTTNTITITTIIAPSHSTHVGHSVIDVSPKLVFAACRAFMTRLTKSAA